MLCVHLHLILVWKMRNVNFALPIRGWKLFGTVSKQMNKEKGKRRPMNLFFIFLRSIERISFFGPAGVDCGLGFGRHLGLTDTLVLDLMLVLIRCQMNLDYLKLLYCEFK